MIKYKYFLKKLVDKLTGLTENVIDLSNNINTLNDQVSALDASLLGIKPYKFYSTYPISLNNHKLVDKEYTNMVLPPSCSMIRFTYKVPGFCFNVQCQTFSKENGIISKIQDPQVILPDFEYYNENIKETNCTCSDTCDNCTTKSYTNVIIDMICKRTGDVYIPRLEIQPNAASNDFEVITVDDVGPFKESTSKIYYREFTAYTYTYGLDGK